MARGVPRTGFHTARFIRVLAERVDGEVAGSKQSFAERLGEWLDFKDAISLFAALNGGAARPAGVGALGEEVLGDELARVHGALRESILNPGRAAAKPPAADLPPSADSAADFIPYHRYYLAHQRDMGAAIGVLRATARTALAGRSAALGRLAALDGVLEQALGARERSLLATVPVLLGKRFARLHQAQRLAPDDPEPWQAAFGRDLQAVLLAELELRLLPVVGLMAALGNELENWQR